MKNLGSSGIQSATLGKASAQMMAAAQAQRAIIDQLGATQIDNLKRAGTIVADPDRQRPRYFDGRFLSAADLKREQDYFLARQADLARASTAGVIHGLEVSGIDNTKLQIQPGNGVTPAGAVVILTDVLTVDLADVAGMQQLDAAFGLDGIPNQPPRRRSGLFVLALRPVEYTANPIAAYPTSITERRTVEDGEIIEAVAVTLVPYPDDQAELSPLLQRAHAARRIFVDGASAGTPAEALPLAMLQLDRGFLVWIDPFLVRREVGAEHGGVSLFGPTPRAVREAYVQQYLRHLEDVVEDRGAPTARFAAAEIFRALPPAGKLPVEAIARTAVLQYTQLFFPPQVRVLMTLIPEDEIAAQVEESLLLPPIDLTATPSELAFTWILILLPAERGDLFTPQLTRAVEVAPAAPGIATRALTLDVPTRLFPPPALPPAVPVTPSQAEINEKPLLAAYVAAHTAGDLRLWYVRRRALRVKPETGYEVQAIDVGVAGGGG
jgi:hypothetical protein